MRVGFLNNQIDNRGTGNALFDYADYNERILGNESFIFSRDQAPRNPLMEERLKNRFKYIYNDWDLDTRNFQLDVLYHIKYGSDKDNSYYGDYRYAVHAVFDVSHPHGDRFAAVSPWLAEQIGYQVKYVPHMIVPQYEEFEPMRKIHGIPDDATVFGRYGGFDSFDISFVWNAIESVLYSTKDTYFLLANTAVPEALQKRWNRRILVEPELMTYVEKQRFIATCDAMLHARARGETFGIACGEFDVAGKPVITYGLSHEQNHYTHLRQPILYFGEEGLLEILENFKVIRNIRQQSLPLPQIPSYHYWTPERVMKRFKEVFLD